MVLFLRRRYVCLHPIRTSSRRPRGRGIARRSKSLAPSPPAPPKMGQRATDPGHCGNAQTAIYHLPSVTIAESRRGFATSKYKALLKFFAPRLARLRTRRIPIRPFGTVITLCTRPEVRSCLRRLDLFDRTQDARYRQPTEDFDAIGGNVLAKRSRCTVKKIVVFFLMFSSPLSPSVPPLPHLHSCLSIILYISVILTVF